MPPRAQLYEPTLEEKPKGPRDPSELVHINVPQVDLSGGLGSVGKAMQIAGHMTGVMGDAQGFLARSLDKLGAQFEHAGDEIFNRATGLQELTNETEAKKAAIEYDTYETKQSTEFSLKKGDAATADALKAHIEDLNKKRNDMAGKMANPSQKRMFENSTMNTLISAGRRAASHAATETRAAANGATDGRIATLGDRFSKTDDIKESEELFQQVYKEFWGTKVPLQGWTKDEADARWKEITSQMYSSKIVQLSHSNPQKAKEMLEANKDFIDAKTYAQVENTVLTNLRDRDSRNIADKIQQDMPDAPYEKKIERAKKDAEKANPNDPKLADQAEQRVTINHNQREKALREEKEKNWQTALDAANGYGGPGGKKPTTKEEYLAVPGARAAFDALSDTDKDKILERLVHNSKADYPLTPAARDRNNELWDEAKSIDPAVRETFMHKDLGKEKIPGAMRDKLEAYQRDMKVKGHEASPTIQRALRVVGNEIDKTFKDPNSSIGKQFRGALQSIIEEETKANQGKPLTDERIREIVGQLLSNDPKTGVWGWGFTQSYIFKQMSEPSSEDLRQLRNIAPHMSDMQLKSEYARIKWKTFSDEYEKLKTQGKVPTPKPSSTPKPSVPTSQ